VRCTPHDQRSPARRDPSPLLRRALAHRHHYARAVASPRYRDTSRPRDGSLQSAHPRSGKRARSLYRLRSRHPRAVPQAPRHPHPRDDRRSRLWGLRQPDPKARATPAPPACGRGLPSFAYDARGRGPGRLGSLRARASGTSTQTPVRLRHGAQLVPCHPRPLHPRPDHGELPARPRPGLRVLRRSRQDASVRICSAEHIRTSVPSSVMYQRAGIRSRIGSGGGPRGT
jgi:hypothetical protein